MALKPLNELGASLYKTLTTEGGVARVPTGYPSIDQQIGGLASGKLILLAARPSFGKTSLLLDISLNVAKANGPVLMCSLEMTALELTIRLASKLARLPYQLIEQKQVGPEDWDALENAIETLRTYSLYIEDNPSLTTERIKEAAFEIHQAEGKLPTLIGVDYVGLLGDDSDNGNDTQRLSAISRRLKGLSLECHCPLLVLSQLSRKPESRDNPRPILSDLRDSGALEQDADTVMFLFRQDAYSFIHPSHIAFDSRSAGHTELIVAKNRNGRTGTVLLDYDTELMSYKELDSGRKQ